ncbi:LL-diaminopimelate aminotransferase [Bdellovibrionota bacterium]
MSFQLAERFASLPPYPFAELDRLKSEARAKGADLIDVGIGDPDQPTPEHIIKTLCNAANDSSNHHYPSYWGMQSFKDAVGRYYERKFSVSLDSKNEIIALIGSKEGIAHAPLAFVNPGENVLVPNPGYPVYQVSAIMAGGIPYDVPLKKENNFLPDLGSIPSDVAKKSRLIFLNYPNNPTSAVATEEFFKEVIEFAKNYDILVCHDAAYLDVSYEGYVPLSFLQIPGAKEVGIEFHSLSKTYNMTGWRIGFAAGNSDLISGLGKVKTNVDSGIFQAIQIAGIEALDGDQTSVEEMRHLYTERRDVLVSGLRKLGLDVETPKATFYVWMQIPKNFKTSAECSAFLLTKAGIVATPGTAFGSVGEGFIRFALTVNKERLGELVKRLEEIL